MSHFCYVLLKIRDEDKRMELLETSLFLAPAPQVVRERGRRVRPLPPLTVLAAFFLHEVLLNPPGHYLIYYLALATRGYTSLQGPEMLFSCYSQ